MLIAVTSNRNDKNMAVPEQYEESADLWIVETDSNKVIAVYARRDEDGLFFAKKAVEHDCEAIACGKMQKTGFEEIAANSITRYYGAGLPPLEAALAAERNLLPLITDYEGGDGCGSHQVDRCAEHLKEMGDRQ